MSRKERQIFKDRKREKEREGERGGVGTDVG